MVPAVDEEGLRPRLMKSVTAMLDRIRDEARHFGCAGVGHATGVSSESMPRERRPSPPEGPWRSITS